MVRIHVYLINIIREVVLDILFMLIVYKPMEGVNYTEIVMAVGSIVVKDPSKVNPYTEKEIVKAIEIISYYEKHF